jgi:hypothetical protein
MLKILAAGAAALFVMASPVAYAQSTSEWGRLSAADFATLTDARINIIKTALQLTPDQEKNWPAVENAIRARAKDRQARIEAIANRVAERRDGNILESLRNRDPVEFLRRRAGVLTQRGADLQKLADAWQPLYQTLKPDQKQRMAFLTLFVLRDMSNVRERFQQQVDDDEE